MARKQAAARAPETPQAPKAAGVVPTIPDTAEHCAACGRRGSPIFTALKSGAWGKACSHCEAPIGQPATEAPRATSAGDKGETSLVAGGALGALQRFVVKVPQDSPGGFYGKDLRGVAHPEQRVVPFPGPLAVPQAPAARPDPRRAQPIFAAPEGASPREVLEARLAEVDLELARLRVETCRLRGLEAEAKLLRREVAALPPEDPEETPT